MNEKWKAASPKEMKRILRPGGYLYGQSGLLTRIVKLSKGDFVEDLKHQETAILYRIAGDPDATGQYATNRRAVVIWLGE